MVHFSTEDIIARAVPIGEGWKKAEIELASGDTAVSPGSTKWVFLGPGTITYLIHPSGWDVTPSEHVSRTYTKG